MSRRRIRNWTIFTDLILINLAFAFAYVVRYRLEWLAETSFHDPYSRYIGQQVLLTVLLAIIYYQHKVWNRRRGEFLIEEISRVGYATATGMAMMMAITFFIRPLAFSRLLLVWALVFIVLFIGLARLIRRLILRIYYKRGVNVDRALIVGSGEAGRSVMRTFLARPDLGYQPIGYLDQGDGENNIGLGRIPHLGNLYQLDQTLRTHKNIHSVFIALPGDMHQQVQDLVRICQQYGVQPQVVPDLFQLSLHHVEFSNMAGIPMLTMRDVALNPFGLFVKRVIDVGVVLAVSVPALILGGLVALAIRLESPGPVLYRQEWVGKDGRLFCMYKFRSMVVNADDQKEALLQMNEASGPIFKIRNDPRLTRVGRIIRRLSLDELPQLWNILRGDMSLVGPRPPLPEEVQEYQPWHMRRLDVKGGLTGLWQVSGRSDLTFDEQCLLDIYYIENWSLAMDLRLMLQTIPHMLNGRGAY